MTKIPDTEFELRVYYKPEQIEFHAHEGICKYCKGIVKMYRDPLTMKLQVDNCRCLLCGQPYFVKLEGTIEDFEIQQWRQKNQTLSMGGDISPKKLVYMDIKDEANFRNTAYRVLIKELEPLEAKGKYKGNSHHLTQRLVELLLTEFKKEKN